MFFLFTRNPVIFAEMEREKMKMVLESKEKGYVKQANTVLVVAKDMAA